MLMSQGVCTPSAGQLPLPPAPPHAPAGAAAEPSPTAPCPAGHLWAVLVAGSAGYGNYRHQADVAHVRALLLLRCTAASAPLL